MADIKLSTVRYYLAGFSTPLVFNKHTFELLRLRTQFGFRVSFRLNLKTKNTRITTLRAPKHFKVGRHHYQLEKNFLLITVNPNVTKASRVPAVAIPTFLKQTGCLVGKRYSFKVFSILSSFRVVFNVTQTMVVR